MRPSAKLIGASARISPPNSSGVSVMKTTAPPAVSPRIRVGYERASGGQAGMYSCQTARSASGVGQVQPSVASA